jgi:hypothetical protein
VLQTKKIFVIKSRYYVKGYKKNQKNFLIYNINQVDAVFEEYEKLRDRLKQNMQIKLNSPVQIDRHKVSALIFLALMKKDFIKVKKDKLYNDIEQHRNIYLGYGLAGAIIKDFYKKDKENQDPKVKELDITIKNTYIIHFRKLIVANEKILKSISTYNNDSINIIFFLSHIFYHLEQQFICQTKIKNLA